MSVTAFNLISRESGRGTQSDPVATSDAATESRSPTADAHSATNEEPERKVLKRANPTVESEARLKFFVSEAESLISVENRVPLDCGQTDDCLGQCLETVKSAPIEGVDAQLSVSAVAVTCSGSHCLVGFAKRSPHETPCHHKSLLRVYSVTRSSLPFFDLESDVG